VLEERLTTLLGIQAAFEKEAWNGLFPFLADDFEFHEPPEQPGATVLFGHEGARKGWARWAEAWTEQRSEPEGLYELPDGRILVLTLERMRGREGIEVAHRAAQVLTFREEKVQRWDSYWDRSNAFAAIDLREEDLKPIKYGAD
jgi:ketosteroid isomerase-like protein